MHKGVEVCLWITAALLLLCSVVFFGAIIGLGAVGITQASMENDQQYITAYCDPNDDLEHVWLYWMAGASGAILPFCLFGTAAIALMITLLREEDAQKRIVERRDDQTFRRDDHTDAPEDIEMEVKGQKGKQPQQEPAEEDTRLDTVQGEDIVHLKQAPLQVFTCGAAIAVASTLVCLSMALLCLLWGIAIANDNARTPNKTVTLYIAVDVIVGIAMPLFLIVATAIFSIFLEYITDGKIDARDVISKMLGIKLEKGDVAEYWVIQNIFYFELSKHDTDVRRDPEERKKRNINLTCPGACSQTLATWILATIASLSFLLAVSYFIDQSITMQLSLQDWPHNSSGEVDCFIAIEGNLIYVNPSEQGLTDRLNDCTMFFEQCENNCTSIINNCDANDNCTNDFIECSNGCTRCLGRCTTNLRTAIEQVLVCTPPPPSTPSCPIDMISCIIGNSTPIPGAMASCMGDGLSLIPLMPVVPVSFSNNTERLQRCTALLEACAHSISDCSVPNCTQLTQCVHELRQCRKPRVIHCFRFLQFGRSTNILESLAESFALFLSVISFFSGTFVVVRILLQFRVTKLWGIGFIIVALFLIGGWITVVVTDVLVQENVIKMFQFVFGFTFILLIGVLLLFAKFWEKKPTKVKPKEVAHLERVTAL